MIIEYCYVCCKELSDSHYKDLDKGCFCSLKCAKIYVSSHWNHYVYFYDSDFDEGQNYSG